MTSWIHLSLLSCPGAVCCLGWSPCGSRFAVASTPGCVQIYSGVGREYTATLEIKEIQVEWIHCHGATLLKMGCYSSTTMCQY